MKKVLLVSSYPFSKTGRGMDVLTECFEESGWETTHLTFPNVFYTVKKTERFETKVNEVISKKAFFPYVDSAMSWFPRYIFKLMILYQQYKACMID